MTATWALLSMKENKILAVGRLQLGEKLKLGSLCDECQKDPDYIEEIIPAADLYRWLKE